MDRDYGDRDRDARIGQRLLYVATFIVVVMVGASLYAAQARGTERATTIARIREIQQALDRYAVDNGGVLPIAGQGLDALRVEPREGPLPHNWCGPYVADALTLRDAWGYSLHYAAPGGGRPQRPYDIWSLGSDNMEGGTDDAADIKSWAPETMTCR